MKKVYFFLLILFLTKSAYAIEFQGKFIQGHFIIGKTDPKTKVWIDKKKVRTSDDGYFVFGIGRNRKYANYERNGKCHECYFGGRSSADG